MRCPKCGYISFDHLENCKKCLKYIGDVTADINGTEYETVAPTFLLTALERRQQTPAPGSGNTNQAEEMMDFETLDTLELNEESETDFILENDGLQQPSRKEISFPDDALMVELDDFKQTLPQEEFSLDLTELQESSESSTPPLDFGDLDISDLAPPVKAEETLSSLFEDKPAQIPAAGPSPTKSVPVSPSTGLQDLTFNRLDLDAPSKLVSRSGAGTGSLPSVKTGTALDKFDIDLGELFTEFEKEKKH